MEFSEIVVKDNPGLCRCCLSEGCYKDMGSDYTWMNETEIYADMLLECFDISISQHNEGPNGPNRLICEVCITRLRDACYFKKQVLDSEKKFVDMVGRGEFKSKVVVYQTQMKAETAEEAAARAEDTDGEYLDDDMAFVDDELDQKHDESEVAASSVTADPLPVRNKRGRPKKATTTKSTKKKVKVEKNKNKALVKDENAPAPYEGCASERRRKNLKTLFNNTTVLPFKWRGRYLCFYCPMNCKDYEELRNHTLSHGSCTTKDYSLRIIKGKHIEIKIDVSEINCGICNEPFHDLNEIIDHLIGKHKMDFDKTVDIPIQTYRLRDLTCLFCEEKFSYFGFLISHVNISHPKNCFICDDCGATFNKKRDLSFHIRCHHRKGGYPCDECSKHFINFYLLRRHKNSVHCRKCNSCNLRFASLALLQKHISMEHPNDGNLICEFCAKQCYSLQGLNKHRSQCKIKFLVPPTETDKYFPLYNVESRKKQDIKQIRKNIQCVLNMSTAVPFKFFSKFSCFYCTKKFVEFDELKAHTEIEHPTCELKSKSMRKCKGERVSVKIDVNNLACKVCGLEAGSLDMLVDHLILEHKANYDKSIVGCLEPFKIMKDNIPCPLCSDRVFRYFGILLRHLNSDHSNNNRICDFCGRSFKNVANLNVHISYTHTGSCECNICGSKYKNQWCLARHRAKCHNAKDYKCPKCVEQFQSQYHKQKHLIKVHNIGHKCEQCGKMFTRNSFMKDHIRRTHLREKNVPCSVCSEKFFDNYLLRMHMVKHDGERKFSCSVCGKAFLRRSNLHSHMEMHKKYGHIGLLPEVSN